GRWRRRAARALPGALSLAISRALSPDLRDWSASPLAEAAERREDDGLGRWIRVAAVRLQGADRRLIWYRAERGRCGDADRGRRVIQQARQIWRDFTWLVAAQRLNNGDAELGAALAERGTQRFERLLGPEFAQRAGCGDAHLGLAVAQPCDQWLGCG